MQRARLRRETAARTLLCAAVILAALLAVAGCGRKSRGAASPEEAAKLFAARVAAQDYEGAADLIAWGEMARSANPDWDDFPSSQRKLIVDKLRDQNMPVLRAIGATLSKTAAKPQVESLGKQDSYLVRLGTEVLVLGTVQTAEGWQVLFPGSSF
ncbi:MAG: hypothetical protein N2512_15490 [Armatimonadetes bacterium]|nr:hypothetical protein [Armatimonadota bacterium]